MINGILSSETKLILETVRQKSFNGFFVYFWITGFPGKFAIDINLKSTGCLIVGNLSADDINYAVFFQ